MATEAKRVLEGGVAVITGGAGGLGSALAVEAATSLEMKVIVVDINLKAAEELVSRIEGLGGYAEAVAVDVSKTDEVAKLANYVFSTHNNVRLLINNAGIETLGFFWEISDRQWDAVSGVNITGVAAAIRAFLPRMLASGQQCWIANVSSLGVLGVLPSQTAYVMTKAAVQALTEGLHTELQLINAPIHVSAVLPGLLRSAIFDMSNNGGSKNADSSLHRFRRHMAELASKEGMDLAIAAKAILEQMLEGGFWVTTHPELTKFIERRCRFLSNMEPPKAIPGVRSILDF